MSRVAISCDKSDDPIAVGGSFETDRYVCETRRIKIKHFVDQGTYPAHDIMYATTKESRWDANIQVTHNIYASDIPRLKFRTICKKVE